MITLESQPRWLRLATLTMKVRTMANDLASKVAVVTGASKGIGAAIATHLATAGATVVVNYASSHEGAERVVKAIDKAGGQAVAVGANLAKPEDVANFFDKAQKAFGRVDILVNNAGIYDFAPLEGVTPEHFHKHFDLNVLGLILATKHAAALFGPEGGTVINISSVAGTHPMPGISVYSATKAAVDAVTKVLAGAGRTEDPGQLDQPGPGGDRGDGRLLGRRDV